MENNHNELLKTAKHMQKAMAPMIVNIQAIFNSMLSTFKSKLFVPASMTIMMAMPKEILDTIEQVKADCEKLKKEKGLTTFGEGQLSWQHFNGYC